MPSPRRRATARRPGAIGPDDLGCRDALNLSVGFSEGLIRPGDRLQTLDSYREFWLNNRNLMSEFIADPQRRDKLDAFRIEPGCRSWSQWTFELLPASPRRPVGEPFHLEHANRPPHGAPWMSDRNYESSYVYLQRRGLLVDGEIEAMRRFHLSNVEHALRGHRSGLFPHLSRIRPRDLALIAELWPDLLAPAELAAAEPFTGMV